MREAPDQDEWDDFQRNRPMRRALRFVGSLLFILLLALLAVACVRRGQVCLEASHSRPGSGDQGWQRNDSIGASVCAEVAPPGE